MTGMWVGAENRRKEAQAVVASTEAFCVGAPTHQKGDPTAHDSQHTAASHLHTHTQITHMTHRPADRVLQALGVLPGQQEGNPSFKTKLQDANPLSYNTQGARARRERHAKSAGMS